MAAYLIVNLKVNDPVAFEEYKAKVPPLIHRYGGEYLVRGGAFAIAEGDWKPSRIVVLQFPDMASARGFYDDPEYQPLKELRLRAAGGDLVFVEGV